MDYVREYVWSTVAAILTVLQLASSFFYQSENIIYPLRFFGYLLWLVSAILGWLPIVTLRREGGVPKGQSYMKTTKLVTTGIYSIVRHPQYLAWYYLNTALILITQHETPTILGILSMIAEANHIGKVDEPCVKKFGEPYREYMKTVPGFNLPLGIIRRMQRQTQSVCNKKKPTTPQSLEDLAIPP